jgi:uncharacterized protein
MVDATRPSVERKDTMYYEAVSQCTRMLRNIGSWLDKAEKHAAAKTFDVNILMTDRLAPDMKPFIYQVQSACDYVKGAAAWLSGQVPPKHEDNEQAIGDARARIQKTVAFAESVSEAQYAGASNRKVSLLSAASGEHLGGKDYLLQITIPNVYFHVATAYAILRHNGVDIGKMDFLGPVNWIDP